MSFPSQIFQELKTGLATLPGVGAVVVRGLRESDPNHIVTLTGGAWNPDSREIGPQQLGPAHGPKTSMYEFTIGAFVKGLGEEDLFETSNDMMRSIRQLVETDGTMRNNLLGMAETGITNRPETVRTMYIKNQKPGRIDATDGDLAFFSVTELTVKVESQ